jgi:peptidoglycan/LPS O-acetylase OafA/YrhL
MPRLYFFDVVRNVTLLAVILFHAVGSYSTVTPHWHNHDGSSVVADVLREVVDAFIMPVFFFISGYFGLASLQRKGVKSFLKGRLRRIGLPWLIAVFVFIPLAEYNGLTTKSRFVTYWLEYVYQTGTPRAVSISSEGPSQMHFWFLSLLLFFLCALCLFYRGSQALHSSAPRAPERRSIRRALLLTGALTSAGHFVSLLFIPFSGWAGIDLLLLFQSTCLFTQAFYFALGAYVYTANWFADGKPPGSLAAWSAALVLLLGGFLLCAQDVYAAPTVSHKLAPVLLLAFACTRSFLCLAILVVLVSSALRYGNRPFPFNQKLAAHSYNVYLVHLTLVVILQVILTSWPGIPPVLKLGIVFFLGTLISVGVSAVMQRYPRGFAGLFVAWFVLTAVGTW